MTYYKNSLEKKVPNPKSKVTLTWTRNLKTQKDKDEFVKVLLSSPRVLKRLDEILVERLDALEKKELSTDSFSKPNWSEYQAHLLGSKKELQEIRQLISFIK